jgi:hypothetical protein
MKLDDSIPSTRGNVRWVNLTNKKP